MPPLVGKLDELLPVEPKRFFFPLEARQELCLKDWNHPHMPKNLVSSITTDGASDLPKRMTTSKVILEFVNSNGELRLRLEDEISKNYMYFRFISRIEDDQDGSPRFTFRREGDNYEVAFSFIT